MWLVVVLDDYYPSVIHYDNEKEAMESFEKNKSRGYATHIVKVLETYINKEDGRANEDSCLDVIWGGLR